ncbi:P-loop containing nucleoside triphosphate hydrolase protein, partial [Dichotomopilus funicola]
HPANPDPTNPDTAEPARKRTRLGFGRSLGAVFQRVVGRHHHTQQQQQQQTNLNHSAETPLASSLAVPVVSPGFGPAAFGPAALAAPAVSAPAPPGSAVPVSSGPVSPTSPGPTTPFVSSTPITPGTSGAAGSLYGPASQVPALPGHNHGQAHAHYNSHVQTGSHNNGHGLPVLPGLVPTRSVSAAARAMSPFGLLSRGVGSVRNGTIGSAAGAGAGAAVGGAGNGAGNGAGSVRSGVLAVEEVRRTIKICLVGDAGTGKTDFFRAVMGSSFDTTTTSTTDLHFGSVVVRTRHGTAANVELWDFPSSIATGHPGTLMSTFFHAAVICFALDDQKNLASVGGVWKPKLDMCLHDGQTFVLGLKRDLRPTFPGLGLNFLPPSSQRVSPEIGQQTASSIHANGYGECSVHANDNVLAAWEGMVHHIVSSLEARERTLRHTRRRERTQLAVSNFWGRLGRRRFGR